MKMKMMARKNKKPERNQKWMGWRGGESGIMGETIKGNLKERSLGR